MSIKSFLKKAQYAHIISRRDLSNLSTDFNLAPFEEKVESFFKKEGITYVRNPRSSILSNPSEEPSMGGMTNEDDISDDEVVFGRKRRRQSEKHLDVKEDQSQGDGASQGQEDEEDQSQEHEVDQSQGDDASEGQEDEEPTKEKLKYDFLVETMDHYLIEEQKQEFDEEYEQYAQNLSADNFSRDYLVSYLFFLSKLIFTKREITYDIKDLVTHFFTDPLLRDVYIYEPLKIITILKTLIVITDSAFNKVKEGSKYYRLEHFKNENVFHHYQRWSSSAEVPQTSTNIGGMKTVKVDDTMLSNQTKKRRKTNHMSIKKQRPSHTPPLIKTYKNGILYGQNIQTKKKSITWNPSIGGGTTLIDHSMYDLERIQNIKPLNIDDLPVMDITF
jgi:hypothetical protein